MADQITLSEYLFIRLKEVGCEHIFGVPGDFVLRFFEKIIDSDIKYVGTCNELNAAYAADGYARIKGFGCVSTTYGVGELSAINGVAGSFAERVPVLAITGAPPVKAKEERLQLHHTMGDYDIPYKMYKLITCASTVLDNIDTAPSEIDRVIRTCVIDQKPGYICFPGDLVGAKCARPKGPLEIPSVHTDPDTLKEALDEAVNMIENSTRPIILADVELKRYHLHKEFLQFLEHTGYPMAVLMMGKTIVDEEHPQFIGMYMGQSSRPYVKDRVESADCIIQVGTVLTDFNSGGFTVHLPAHKSVSLYHNRVVIKHHTYEHIGMKDFLHGLTHRLKQRNAHTLDIKRASESCIHRRTEAYQAKNDSPMTVERLFDRISHFIPENAIVIAETGVSLFAAAETMMPKGATFIGQIFYGSIGYTVGSALGAAIAAPNRKVVLIIGDGSFQVTCQDLSTMIRYGTKPVVFLLNNDGYTIERVIIDGPFNDIQSWKYHQIPETFGGKRGDDVHTEGDLEKALDKSNDHRDDMAFIEVHLGRLDCSKSLKEAGQAMAARFPHTK